jgi:hypothetical protein
MGELHGGRSGFWLVSDPPPTKTPVPPDPDTPSEDIDPDDVPATPPVEPPPVPIRDPHPSGTPSGPYIVGSASVGR